MSKIRVNTVEVWGKALTPFKINQRGYKAISTQGA